MYWKEIPVQVQAEADGEQASRQLDPRFQEAADAVAMFDGSTGTDEYLEAWEWGPFYDVDGPVEQAAEAEAERINNGMPEDFVARIRDLQNSGERDPRPGAIDDWID